MVLKRCLKTPELDNPLAVTVPPALSDFFCNSSWRILASANTNCDGMVVIAVLGCSCCTFRFFQCCCCCCWLGLHHLLYIDILTWNYWRWVVVLLNPLLMNIENYKGFIFKAILFVSPAKHSGTLGSLCPASVCLSVLITASRSWTPVRTSGV